MVWWAENSTFPQHCVWAGNPHLRPVFLHSPLSRYHLSHRKIPSRLVGFCDSDPEHSPRGRRQTPLNWLLCKEPELDGSEPPGPRPGQNEREPGREALSPDCTRIKWWAATYGRWLRQTLIIVLSYRHGI